MQLSLPKKLSIAIKIADCLSVIHKKNIIHKNINPSNIIWNKETNRVEIIDYAIAVELKREMAHKMNLHFFEGSAKYCSPEQTGRINRPVDSRSDLYLWALLFTNFLLRSALLLEKMIASLSILKLLKTRTPHTIKKNIPEMVSMILLKLLEKDADDRYQMASGVKKDLEQCLDNVLYNNEVIPLR
jgi:serine/threonine protein kinase